MKGYKPCKPKTTPPIMNMAKDAMHIAIQPRGAIGRNSHVDGLNRHMPIAVEARRLR